MYKMLFLTFFSLTCLSCTKAAEIRSKRGYFSSSYSHSPHYNAYEPPRLPPYETDLYSLGIETFLPFPQGDTLSLSKANIIPVALSNSVEKPVQEPSDSIPQPTRNLGTAVIPLTPPPAVPVSAAAARVPTVNGAVFLGSGGLGVINLGNGAFALGSGGIAYSNMRQQPRPNGFSPLYPPLAANPNLVPAATPSQQVQSIIQASQPVSQLNPNGLQFGQPLLTFPQRQVDQNGYERLDPNTVAFGMPTPRVRPLKTRNSYATPTVQQVQVEPVHVSQLAAPGFGDPIPRLPPQAVTYNN